jgi:hypothetical protein
VSVQQDRTPFVFSIFIQVRDPAIFLIAQFSISRKYFPDIQLIPDLPVDAISSYSAIPGNGTKATVNKSKDEG